MNPQINHFLQDLGNVLKEFFNLLIQGINYLQHTLH